MNNPLEKSLRRILESTVIKARDIAEAAAREDLERLSVGDAVAGSYLNDEQRKLRNRLRAHGRQLGDMRKADGRQSIEHLVAEIAYEHWHRMLFARFLAENNLLMYEDGVTPLSLQDCFDLAKDEGGEGWEYAARYAATMLPQIFRPDSPAFEVKFAPNHQHALEKLLMHLDVQTFQASDSLGWVYQFWQSKKKEEVNASEVKIGADELSAVTQLFTEPYMVSFLLDNSLGAWWAAQCLSEDDLRNAASEDELRRKAAIPGVPLEYVRFVKLEDGGWAPAAGSFDSWPEHLSELKTLDPCCGSGHFLVAAFMMLVPMRMEMEDLSARDAVDAVLRENIHGLELDQRCVELAAFALAFSAWKYPYADGYRSLPELHIACSGLGINSKKEAWLALAGENSNLRLALEQLYRQFKDAPVLGSLINPEESLSKGSLFEIKMDEVAPLLTKALAGERNDVTNEKGVVAKGLLKATSILTSKYTLVATNVPYLGRGKQDDTLIKFVDERYPYALHDLGGVFIARTKELLSNDGALCLVTPQNWAFLKRYKQLRQELFKSLSPSLIAELGNNAFNTPLYDFSFMLTTFINKQPNKQTRYRTILANQSKTPYLVSIKLSGGSIAILEYSKTLDAPCLELFTQDVTLNDPLSDTCDVFCGIITGDNDRFVRKHWELIEVSGRWEFYQRTTNTSKHYGGMEQVIFWEGGVGEMSTLPSFRGLNKDLEFALNTRKMGFVIHRMGKLPCSIALARLFDQNGAVIVPKNPEDAVSVWDFIASKDYNTAVRTFDNKTGVTPKTLVKPSFNKNKLTLLNHYMPQPYSDDPTQWIFHGHPCGSVVWDEDKKWTAHGALRTDDTVLQIAVARLLDYRWPAELDTNMELADEQREWVNRCEALLPLADDDGIVCLSVVRGEKAAADRLEAMLQAAFGDAWSSHVRNKLLEAVGCQHKSLDFWLREKFFEQHCKLFQHRPFIWHVWDGLKDGFSALLNYHQLDKQGLERLIYTYLDDWIRTQTHQQAEGIDGADIRKQAAQDLKRQLEQILKGEAPYDIFVRWKPLEQQPVGWNPDINDGVRLNIRPFMMVEDVARRGAGILRFKPNIHWKKDRGKDVASAPWYSLGLEYGGKEGDRINEHHLSLLDKQAIAEKK